MRTKLTDLEREAYKEIRRYQKKYQNLPTTAELAGLLDRENNSMGQYLYEQLEKKGFIKRVPCSHTSGFNRVLSKYKVVLIHESKTS
jgi:FPC/CPF motif-containing protein YcgG